MTSVEFPKGRDKRPETPKPELVSPAWPFTDVPTLAQILREECGALDIDLPDSLEYAQAQRIARRLQQER